MSYIPEPRINLAPDSYRLDRTKTELILDPDTVVEILSHVCPLRTWCNASVVWSRPSARDSRIMSNPTALTLS